MFFDFDKLEENVPSRQRGPPEAAQASLPAAKVAHEAEEVDPAKASRRAAVTASRTRVAAATKVWWDVLGLSPQAGLEDVKRAFKELALLHHPDKADAAGLTNEDGDEVTFRRVRAAYEEALELLPNTPVEVAPPPATSSSSPVATAVSTSSSPALWPVAISAPKAQLRRAVDHWEHAYDEGKTPTVPDEVPLVSPAELVEWMLEPVGCIVLDTREEVEARYERRRQPVPGAVRMSFGELRTSPEGLVPQVARLLGASQRIVAFSTHGGTSGNCGMSCALLTDVFGIKSDRVWRLDGGLQDWSEWASSHPQEIRKLSERLSRPSKTAS